MKLIYTSLLLLVFYFISIQGQDFYENTRRQLMDDDEDNNRGDNLRDKFGDNRGDIPGSRDDDDHHDDDSHDNRNYHGDMNYHNHGCGCCGCCCCCGCCGGGNYPRPPHPNKHPTSAPTNSDFGTRTRRPTVVSTHRNDRNRNGDNNNNDNNNDDNDGNDDN